MIRLGLIHGIWTFGAIKTAPPLWVCFGQFFPREDLCKNSSHKIVTPKTASQRLLSGALGFISDYHRSRSPLLQNTACEGWKRALEILRVIKTPKTCPWRTRGENKGRRGSLKLRESYRIMQRGGGRRLSKNSSSELILYKLQAEWSSC